MRVAVIGASGGLGRAFVDLLSPQHTVYALSRRPAESTSKTVIPIAVDIENEDSICEAAKAIEAPLDRVIVASGFLHNETIQPEKSIKDLNTDAFVKSMCVNTIGVALIGKHFLPLMNKTDKSVFAALSARVGSIEDNQLGGWYAYRASKAALNMVLKNFAIEMQRKNKELVILGLQPGTVATSLSQPFRSNVSQDDLKTPDESAKALLEVIDASTSEQSGQLLDWSGQRIPY